MPSPLPLVFVSYASADAGVAGRLAAAIREAGFSTWLYQQDSLPGGSYLQQIHAAVSGSHVIAVLVSTAALQSHQVEKEIVLGHDLGKPFVPILIGLSHDDMQRQKPDYRTAFGAAVSVPLTDETFADVADRVIGGLRKLMEKDVPARPGNSPAPVAQTEPRTEDSGQDGEWASLSQRLQNFHPEVVRLRNHLRRTWPKPVAVPDGRSRDASLAGNRVRIADAVVNDLLEVAGQEWAPAPAGCALVARGGYGRGVLSVGSDIDLTLLHAEDAAKQAEAFWSHYTTALTDVWSAVSGIRTAPIIMATNAGVQSWDAALRAGDLAPLVSFAFSRHLGGNMQAHDQLRAQWRAYVAEMPPDVGESMLRAIRERVSASTVSAQSTRFDIKHDAGGILQYRLTGFLEQVLDVRCGHAEQPGFSVPDAHHYLLELREQVCTLTQSHVLTHHHLPRIAARMNPDVPRPEQVDAMMDDLSRHRRRIRSGLLQALEAAESLFQTGSKTTHAS